MLKRMRLKANLQKQQRKSALFQWIQTQISKLNYNLSDAYCNFAIRDIVQQKGLSLIIELYIQPLSGAFQGIEFRPKIFISSINFTTRPRIYNDRRLFHPNINIYTCQIVFPEIVRDWNPTQQFNMTFQNLKYVLLEPNLRFVPNTQFNKRAAWNYHFNKKKYRELIVENNSLYLEQVVGQQFDIENETRMEVQSNNETQEIYSEEDYWSIEALTRKNIREKKEENEHYDEERSILLLTKQIKCLEMNEYMEGRHLSEYETMQD